MPIIHVNVWEGFGQEKAKITLGNWWRTCFGEV